MISSERQEYIILLNYFMKLIITSIFNKTKLIIIK